MDYESSIKIIIVITVQCILNSNSSAIITQSHFIKRCNTSISLPVVADFGITMETGRTKIHCSTKCAKAISCLGYFYMSNHTNHSNAFTCVIVSQMFDCNVLQAGEFTYHVKVIHFYCI